MWVDFLRSSVNVPEIDKSHNAHKKVTKDPARLRRDRCNANRRTDRSCNQSRHTGDHFVTECWVLLNTTNSARERLKITSCNRNANATSLATKALRVLQKKPKVYTQLRKCGSARQSSLVSSASAVWLGTHLQRKRLVSYLQPFCK